jgi:small lipoprotein (TIGR04454 family)
MQARPRTGFTRSARLGALIFSVSALSVLAGCGRKATEADCQLIVDRNVELQMKAMNITDTAAIAKKQEELRKEMKEELHGECLGRRVTDAMMACVRGAKSTDEINQCVR